MGIYGEENIEEEWEKQAEEVVAKHRQFDWLLHTATGGPREKIDIQTL